MLLIREVDPWKRLCMALKADGTKFPVVRPDSPPVTHTSQLETTTSSTDLRHALCMQ